MLGALILLHPAAQEHPGGARDDLYTNPFTIVPLYLVAYEYGRLLVGDGAVAAQPSARWLGRLQPCGTGCSASASRSRSAWWRSR